MARFRSARRQSGGLAGRPDRMNRRTFMQTATAGAMIATDRLGAAGITSENYLLALAKERAVILLRIPQ